MNDKDKSQKVIFVNTVEHAWNNDVISYEELVVLAFGAIENQDTVGYTIVYSRGNDEHGKEGILTVGDILPIKNKMIFDVTRTNKS